jgi:hypothetical protein
MELHDTVITKTNITDIPTGSVGTIVHVYSDAKAFAVEFVKSDGSIAVETVLSNQLAKHTDNICENIRYGGKNKCEDLYNCCNCGGDDCGCGGCFSCNACIVCLTIEN